MDQKAMDHLFPGADDAAAHGAEADDGKRRHGARADLVREAIKTGIREGRLRAGQRLREADLAEWLGVSRTPVREALKTLEAQGLVATVGREGLVIASLSARDVAELYTVWADMEALAARYAAENARPSDIKLMLAICDKWDEKLDAAELGRLNHQLHQAIYDAAHNAFLHRALDAIDDSLALLGLHTYSVPARRAEAGLEHRAIVEAIARHDPQQAANAALTHIQTSEKLRLSLLAESPPFL
ncbi:GntR family transcriptional regulator [Lacisediminimonas sp.]|uniref:GntR family transcriptional regulator n=1 Tax=Lacisediminimonas sp. TaxID=3060582 RepID=UPI002728EA6F|nr:GntR family transcriptional regulator [Lacisediminimonas sp.]MDO8300810.1 GntR family transcriptional regulator [Lacisediminimonas sp.]